MITKIAYSKYQCKTLTNRTFAYADIQNAIINTNLNFEIIGESFEGRAIKLVKLGKGSINIMLWSQMHGDEPTATAALFDLLNFFTNSTHDQELKESILSNCTLFIVPVINPDGMENFTRRNAQEIDINRDYLAQQSPEGNILRKLRDQIKPNFAFNLHDQGALYSIPKTKNTVAISLLAPVFDATLAVNWNREQAMKVIICMNETLQKLIPQQVAKFNDEFEPRAFGDNFQKSGSATILIESGTLINDPEKQEIRKLNFYAILSALNTICNLSYQEKDLINYLMIPVQKNQLFHILLKNCSVINNTKSHLIDIGINYTEVFDKKTRKLKKHFQIADTGDLRDFNAFEIIDAKELILIGKPKFEQAADLELKDFNNQIIAKWSKGTRI
jgi:hypothetical protein